MSYTRNVEGSEGSFTFSQYVIQSHISMVNYCWTFSLIRLNWKTEVSYQLCPRYTHGTVRGKFRWKWKEIGWSSSGLDRSLLVGRVISTGLKPRHSLPAESRSGRMANYFPK